MGGRFAGRYELVDHLGHGGGGSVWRAGWAADDGDVLLTMELRSRPGRPRSL